MSITILIIAITSIISFIAFTRHAVKDDLLFWPYKIKREGQLYRFVTHGVLHADAMHLIFNMVSFYSFGMALEHYLFLAIFGEMTGALLAVMYVTAIIIAVIPDYFIYQDRSFYRSLGASGAVSAVVFSAITIQPKMPIQFFFIPYPIPGYIFGIGFLGVSAVLAKKGSGNIGHNAHFWGSIYGILFTYLTAKFIAKIDLLDYFFKTVVK